MTTRKVVNLLVPDLRECHFLLSSDAPLTEYARNSLKFLSSASDHSFPRPPQRTITPLPKSTTNLPRRQPRPSRENDSIHEGDHIYYDYIDPAAPYALPGDTLEINFDEVSRLQSSARNPLDCNQPPLPNFAPPRSPEELVTNLMAWRSPEHDTPFLFATFHKYHKQYCRFTSQRSFRILIDIAIKQANFGSVHFLLREMERSGINPAQWTHDTWAIWVRWMVRTGKWPDAWQAVQQSFPRSLVNDQPQIPLAVWLEFWAGAKRGAMRQRVKDQSGKTRRYTVVHFPYELNSDMGRYHILMDNAPMLDQHRTQAVPARVVYAIVRARLWGGKRDWAVAITRNFFRTAAATDDPLGKVDSACLGLIHLHLAVGWKKFGFPALRTGQAILNELLELNPRVRPDSRTLALLLRMLGRTALSGINAERLVKQFEKKYGAGIGRERVLLRVAALAVKEKNVKVLDRTIKRQERSVGLKRRGCLEYWRWRKLIRRRRILASRQAK